MSVAHADDGGRVRLPAAYVAEDVALAYAVTVHKAQGLTVDHAIAVVDEATTAEALYVAMTRGRRTNTALAVTDPIDLERPSPEPRSAAAVFAAALDRSAAQVSAHELLRRQLDRSESLAVLGPRRAHVEAWIVEHTPPDPARDLEQLARQRAAHQMHPGRLTKRGRADRRSLDHFDRRQAELEAARQVRVDWLARHADTFAYRDQLDDTIAARRTLLGELAAQRPPDHLVELLGPRPDEPIMVRAWDAHAGYLEAYRERWDLVPERVRECPADPVQYRDWDTTLATARMIRTLNDLTLRHGHERTLGYERNLVYELGIEL